MVTVDDVNVDVVVGDICRCFMMITMDDDDDVDNDDNGW